MDSIQCIDNNQFLNAYWEISDFIDDYGNKDNQVSIGEYEIFILLLEKRPHSLMVYKINGATN